MAIDARLGCSTISFRHLPLPEALAVIIGLGFAEIDLGALPGVCDHVPYELTGDAVRESPRPSPPRRLRVRSVNGDVGDLNRPLDARQRADRDEHLQRLLELTAAIDAQALVLPCGAQRPRPDRRPGHRPRPGRGRAHPGRGRRRTGRRRSCGWKACTTSGSAGTSSVPGSWPTGWPATRSGWCSTSATSSPPGGAPEQFVERVRRPHRARPPARRQPRLHPPLHRPRRRRLPGHLPGADRARLLRVTPRWSWRPATSRTTQRPAATAAAAAYITELFPATTPVR